MKPSKLKRRWRRRCTHNTSVKFERWMSHHCEKVQMLGGMLYRIEHRGTTYFIPVIN
jgi:hypothetical protein